jgi:hypothetical protein
MQVDAARKLKAKLEEAGMALVPLPDNLVDAVWGDAIPAPPATQLRVHALEWAGQSVADKLAGLRAKLEGARPRQKRKVFLARRPWTHVFMASTRGERKLNLAGSCDDEQHARQVPHGVCCTCCCSLAGAVSGAQIA